MNLRNLQFITIAFSVFFAGCSNSNVPPPKTSEKKFLTTEQIQLQIIQVKENIKQKPKWLFPIGVCPAEVMPESEIEADFAEESCGQNPLECYERCKNENGNACYALAVLLQQNSGIEQDEAEPLHLRACRLGIVSGCTNRAAAILNLEQDNADAVRCSVNTFKKTCEKNDPWGCYMLGHTLAYGKGVKVDLDKSISVLTKACRFGLEDEACRSAKLLEKQILDYKKSKRKHTIKHSNKK